MPIPRGTVVHLTPDWDLRPGPRPGATRLWPFTQIWWLPYRSTDPRRLDPINALVLGAPPAMVHAALASTGWERPADGGTHRTWVNGSFRHMVDHIALGTRAERVHVRLFKLWQGTLVAAHHEVADDDGRHVVTSWDHAREVVCEALAGVGFEQLAPTGPVVPRDVRGIPGDGRVWRLLGPAR